MRSIRLVLLYLWASPTVALVLPLGLLLWALGQIRPLRWSYGAWEWSRVRGSLFDRAMAGWAATTIGWTILWTPPGSTGAFPPWDVPQLASHERWHVAQALYMGPMFLPIYLLLSAFYGYSANPMEADARRKEQTSWPPSPWTGVV